MLIQQYMIDCSVYNFLLFGCQGFYQQDLWRWGVGAIGM